MGGEFFPRSKCDTGVGGKIPKFSLVSHLDPSSILCNSCTLYVLCNIDKTMRILGPAGPILIPSKLKDDCLTIYLY